MDRRSTYQWYLLFAVALLALGAIASTAKASILLPEETTTDVQQLFADLEGGAAATSSSSSTSGNSSTPSPSEGDKNEPDDLEIARLLTAANSPTGGSTSSTSSGGATSGVGSNALSTLSAAPTPDINLVGWTQSEARFALPMPPGNDLLRPPQGI